MSKLSQMFSSTYFKLNQITESVTIPLTDLKGFIELLSSWEDSDSLVKGLSDMFKQRRTKN